MRCIVAAASGGLGATALALVLIPALLHRRLSARQDLVARVPNQLSPERLARYASAVSLPLAATGWIVALPTLTASYIALVLSCALAYRSGSHGARAFLGLTGLENARIAALTSLVATLPSFLAVPLNAVR